MSYWIPGLKRNPETRSGGTKPRPGSKLIEITARNMQGKPLHAETVGWIICEPQTENREHENIATNA